MTRRTVIAGVVGLAAAPVIATGLLQPGRRRGGEASLLRPPRPVDEIERRIIAVLDEMQAQGRTYLSVPPDDGRWLRLLTEVAAATRVVEVGTSTGYSSLWLALALVRTDGRLTTFEIDEGRAESARGHFKKAGVSDRVSVVVGDAHETVKQVEGPVDVVFIDADKDGYVDYLSTLGPKVKPGGLLLGHNVGAIAPYIEAVTGDAKFETLFYMGGSGLAVTLRKRG